MTVGTPTALGVGDLERYLAEVRSLVLTEVERIIPRGTRYDADLYDPMRSYPMREAKGLRPALAYAVCKALGGRAEAVLPTAAVLELYHNAFLVHDDVEDGSWSRRGGPTLHTEIGAAAAINVGDAMLALCLRPLLDNTRLVGLGPALRVLRAVADMARETAEGQALELGWIRRGEFALEDRDYLRMVHQKTTWYTFLTPIRVGAILAGAEPILEWRLRRWGTLLGAAFQIQDDVLNVLAEEEEYGKEIDGDLWEGKRTLILISTMRRARAADRARALAILAKPRPPLAGGGNDRHKSLEDIRWLRALIRATGGVEHAREQALDRVRAAERALASACELLDDSVHRDFMAGLTAYVLGRSR